VSSAQAWLAATFVVLMIHASWGDQIAGALNAGARAGGGQAAAEVRTMRDRTAGWWGRRTTEGREAGPRSRWWWLDKATTVTKIVARTGRRALRKDSPARRVLAAARQGAARGREQARARARAARQPGVRGAARHALRNYAPVMAAAAAAGRGWRRARARWRRRNGQAPAAAVIPAGLAVTAAGTPLPGTAAQAALDAGAPRAPELVPDPGDAPLDGAVLNGRALPPMASSNAAVRRSGSPASRASAVAGGRGSLAAISGRGGEGRISHGRFMRASAVVVDEIALNRACAEAEEAALAVADAGETQKDDCRKFTGALAEFLGLVESGLEEIDGRLGPLADATTDAGGPGETASPAYNADY
jgi:hypothetical protein